MSTSKYLSCNNVNDGVYYTCTYCTHIFLWKKKKTDDRLVNKTTIFFFATTGRNWALSCMFFVSYEPIFFIACYERSCALGFASDRQLTSSARKYLHTYLGRKITISTSSCSSAHIVFLKSFSYMYNTSEKFRFFLFIDWIEMNNLMIYWDEKMNDCWNFF